MESAASVFIKIVNMFVFWCRQSIVVADHCDAVSTSLPEILDHDLLGLLWGKLQRQIEQVSVGNFGLLPRDNC